MDNWVNKQVKERPFFSALIVLLIVMVPGYWRLEMAVDTANDAAEQAEQNSEDLAAAISAQAEENKSLAIETCKTRNTASQNSRARFEQLFSGLEAIFIASPNQTDERKIRAQAFLASLRNSVPLDAESEDVDCDGDGKLTESDYSL
jgi:hypothetical protein